jgi:hypothetical protein
MKLLRRLAKLCTALAFVSCAHMQPRLLEVKVPPERISLKGFSLVPLNEKGWFIREHNPNQLFLGKLGKSPEENLVIRAILFKMPAFNTNEEFSSLIKEIEAKNINPERLKIIKHTVTPHQTKKGSDCALSRSLLEDNAAAELVGKTGVMLQESVTLICAHPQNKDIGVSVGYSQRYYPEQGDLEFFKKAVSVLNSVRFTEF